MWKQITAIVSVSVCGGYHRNSPVKPGNVNDVSDTSLEREY